MENNFTFVFSSKKKFSDLCLYRPSCVFGRISGLFDSWISGLTYPVSGQTMDMEIACRMSGTSLLYNTNIFSMKWFTKTSAAPAALSLRPPTWPPRPRQARKLRTRKKTQSRNADAMGDNAKPLISEKKFGKRVRRRETLRHLKNAHRRETQKHFRNALPALLFNDLNPTWSWAKQIHWSW